MARSFSLEEKAALLRAAFLLAAFFAPFTMYLKRAWHWPAAEPLYAAGYAWMGMILVAAFVFGLSDLARLALKGRPDLHPALARAALGLLAAALAAGFYGGLRTPGIREVEVPVKDLPASLDGLRIVQVSDMHVDSEAKLRRFAKVAGLVNAAGPDLLLVTGDFIDPGLSCREGLAAVAGSIRTKHGIYGVFGNHEYYYGMEEAAECYKAFGIRLLRNAHTDAGGLRLVGLGDIHTERLTEDEAAEVLGKASGGPPLVVMTHQPLYYPRLAGFAPALVLSGHTHRGQIFPFHFFTRLFYRYFYGPYTLGESFFYVSSGAGTWGPPIRLFAPAEIPVFTLRRA